MEQHEVGKIQHLYLVGFLGIRWELRRISEIGEIKLQLLDGQLLCIT